MDISYKDTPGFIKATKYLDAKWFYELIILPLGIVQGQANAFKDASVWMEHKKAVTALWKMFRKDILNGKIKSGPESLVLPEDPPGLAYRGTVERTSVIKWYKKHAKVIARLYKVAEPDILDSLFNEQLDMFKNIEASLSGHGEEVRGFMAKISKKGGEQSTRRLGIQLAVEQILNNRPSATAGQVWNEMEQYLPDKPLHVEGYRVYVDGKTIHQDKTIILNDTKRVETRSLVKASFPRYVSRAKK